ncbi:MAG: L,D-transpeptidase [Verrucomicrobiota bacterium]|nr:L,D-transpeptidase [Verrucomicrobiota bacterium]
MLFRLCLITLFLLPVVRLNAASDDPIPPRILISVRDQKLMVIEDGKKIAVYPVSTSKFGLGDRWGSMATPLGWLQVAEKIGDHAPPGAVFHKRRFTGEILPPNAPGRDPIVTRIIWLRGLERTNANAFNRCIYIHGTAEEKTIGKPASYGCVRMSSKDVSAVYSQINIGALVRIIPDSLPKLPKQKDNPHKVIFTAAAPAKSSAPGAKKEVATTKSDPASKSETPPKNGSIFAFLRRGDRS